jgi:hypothetical protein
MDPVKRNHNKGYDSILLIVNCVEERVNNTKEYVVKLCKKCGLRERLPSTQSSNLERPERHILYFKTWGIVGFDMQSSCRNNCYSYVETAT